MLDSISNSSHLSPRPIRYKIIFSQFLAMKAMPDVIGVERDFTSILDGRTKRLIGLEGNYEKCDDESRDDVELDFLMGAYKHGIIHRAKQDKPEKHLHPEGNSHSIDSYSARRHSPFTPDQGGCSN